MLEEFMIDNYDDCVARARNYLKGSDQQEAEDIVADTYIKLMEAQTEFRGETIRGLVMTALRNNCFNHLKVMARRRELEDENHDAILTETGMQGHYADTMDELIAIEEFDNKMDSLSPLLRRTAEDLLLEGMTPEQLAESEGTTANVVYQRIFRIKEALGEK